MAKEQLQPVSTTLCGGSDLRKEISRILHEDFFRPISGIDQDTILDWYESYRGSFYRNEKKTSITHGLPLPKNNLFIGHDLPVWIEGEPFKRCDNGAYAGAILPVTSPMEDKLEGEGGRVLIIGQDPLRNYANRDRLEVMSPWGLHSPRAYTKHGRFFNWIICPLLAKGCAIYVTDYYKLFATGMDMTVPKGTRIKDSRGFVSNLPNIDYAKILEEEIGAFKPTHIVVLGSISNTVTRAINDACNGTTPIHAYHPNAFDVNRQYFGDTIISKIQKHA